MKLPWKKETPAKEAAPKLTRLESAILESLEHEPQKWTQEIAGSHRLAAIKATNRTLAEIVVILSWSTEGGEYRATYGPVQFSPAFATRWHRIVEQRAAVHASELQRKEEERAKLRLTQLFDAV